MRLIRTCAITDCNAPVSGRGYCQKHYQRLRRHGDPLALKINRTKSADLQPCKVDGCQRYAEARGMCKSHWARWRKTGDPGPADFLAAPRSPDDTHRSCSKCGLELPVEKFPSDPRYPEKRTSICFACKAVLDRSRALARRYGMTAKDYDDLLQQQGGKCAVCGSENRLCVDHCHQSTKVRGILCDRCNVALGAANDDPDVLRGLADYLDRHRH